MQYSPKNLLESFKNIQAPLKMTRPLSQWVLTDLGRDPSILTYFLNSPKIPTMHSHDSNSAARDKRAY